MHVSTLLQTTTLSFALVCTRCANKPGHSVYTAQSLLKPLLKYQATVCILLRDSWLKYQPKANSYCEFQMTRTTHFEEQPPQSKRNYVKIGMCAQEKDMQMPDTPLISFSVESVLFGRLISDY